MYRYIIYRCVLFFTESCGCPQRDDVDYRDYSCSRIISAVQKEVNESHLFELEGALSECEEFDEIFEKTGEFFKHMECDEVYFLWMTDCTMRIR